MLGSVKVAQKDVILEIDPAVKGGYEKYRENNYDESFLKLEGKPTRFKIKQLTRREKKFISRKIKQEPSQIELDCYTLESISVGLIAIDNFKVINKAGEQEEIGELPTKRIPDIGDVIDIDFLESLNLDDNILYSLAAEIQNYSTYIPPFLLTHYRQQSGATKQSKEGEKKKQKSSQSSPAKGKTAKRKN